MRKFFQLLLSFCMLVFFSLDTMAQTRTITGVVKDANNKPLSDITVTVRGTNIATKTNASGGYSIQASNGQTLLFTSVSYGQKQVRVGSSDTYNMSLVQTETEMEEVVVTAMDIRRNPRELGYSVQTVDGDEIQETQRENFINSLQGRVAGLTINSTSGTAGASSSIVLRGFNSLSLSNQPLFVIDGVIADNGSLDENSQGGSGVGMVERTGLTSTSNRNTDYSNRISDINPNDIQSVTVLKGPEATALYGSQASSGAIIITTRRAKTNKLGIQYDNSFRFQKIVRKNEVLKGYASGINGVSDTTYGFRYFGAPYGPGTTTYNNVDNFFRTGFAQTHNLGLEFGVGESKFRFSTSIFDQQGVTPNNDYKRINLRLANTTKIGKYVDISPAISFIKTDNNKVLRSAGGFLIGLLAWPDTNDIRNWKDEYGNKNLLFSDNPNADFDNPLFNVNKNLSYDENQRVSTSLGININPTDWLSVAGRFGYETYKTEGYLRYHPLSYYLTQSTLGLQDNFWREYEGYNHTITATVKKTLNKDLNVRLMVGTMWQDYENRMFAITGNGIIDSIVNGRMWKSGQELTDANYNQLVGSPADSNVTTPSTRKVLLRNAFGEYNKSIMRQFATFGEIAVNWREMIFLNYTHRFEQASTLPKQNRNYNYPGASLSIIVSDLIPAIKNSKTINFVKLRASRASTARLNLPYSTQSFFTNNLGSGGGFSYAFTNNNPDLEPEKQNTFEVGTEWRFFNNRLNLDASYYNTLNEGQIIEAFRLSYITGYVLNTQNAGSTRNRGIEVSLDATIVQKQDFNWNMRFNFNKMYNKVIQMPKNVAEYYIADTWVYNNARGGLSLNGPTTTITSYGYARNDAGDIIINPTTGLPVADDTWKVRGDRNPDFTLGYNNLITYKNWQLNFLWDFKFGGDIFNGTEMYLTAIGKSVTTADRYTPRVIEGVLQDGLENTDNPTRNNIVITPAYQDSYYTGVRPEAFIEKDVNWARLKDLTLNYRFSPETIKAIRGMKSLTAFVTVNDLVIITNYSGADPSVNGNTAGARGVGAFGFDYGTLPTPISINLGLRAAF